ncbi:hypothetical protein [Deinococcus hopiensis]|uniref:hypothetical protein n=1 Tax=Deinococcus hopiensis TaxID=309885 RepID=UPI00111C6849|nr:hypothetical protein [Deinococcus hopiensis]
MELPVTRHPATTFGAVAAALGATQADTATSATRLMKLGGPEAQRCARLCGDAAQTCVENALAASSRDLAGSPPRRELPTTLPLKIGVGCPVGGGSVTDGPVPPGCTAGWNRASRCAAHGPQISTRRAVWCVAAGGSG